MIAHADPDVRASLFGFHDYGLLIPSSLVTMGKGVHDQLLHG